VIFHLSKSQIHLIIQTGIKELSNKAEKYFDLDNSHNETLYSEYPLTIGIVDSTELQIQCWQQKSFSGKKKAFTLKYQVTIGINSGKVLHIFGPKAGSIHDITIYHESQLPQWLCDNSVTVLGDKGYIGCNGVITPFKRRRREIPLTFDQQMFNVALAQKRIKVENHFASLKKWKVLSHIYRGSLESHKDIFLSCELLISLEWNS